MEETASLLREAYGIPECYQYHGIICGKHNFSFCDSDIRIGTDGKATETYMGLNADATGHKFITIPWKS